LWQRIGRTRNQCSGHRADACPQEYACLGFRC
jgi:hypothetical protein